MVNMNRTLKWIAKFAACGFIGLIFFILLDLVMWYCPPERGWAPWKWESSGPVAVGGNYSVELLTRTAHVFLAEYDQRLVVFGGTERNGEKKGTVELQMNTGGRTHIMIYSAISKTSQLVLLKDRFGISRIDLKNMKRESELASESTSNYTFIGTVSGEAYPLKFVPVSIWSEVESLKKING
jgi:hypothetical protein